MKKKKKKKNIGGERNFTKINKRMKDKMGRYGVPKVNKIGG